MLYIEAPSTYEVVLLGVSVYLAGGITGCPDWQQEMTQLLNATDLTLLNPRRRHFPTDNPNTAREQIVWEYNALRDASAILFWFPRETLCPIVLYELGAWSMTDKPIYVGVHPEYERRQDVEIQTELTRPDVKVVYSITDLAKQVESGGHRYYGENAQEQQGSGHLRGRPECYDSGK